MKWNLELYNRDRRLERSFFIREISKW